MAVGAYSIGQIHSLIDDIIIYAAAYPSAFFENAAVYEHSHKSGHPWDSRLK